MKKIISSIILLSICAFSLFAEGVKPAAVAANVPAAISATPAPAASAANLAQRAPLTISAGSITMRGLIEKIESETDYLFVFSEKDINLNERINISEGKKTVADCLSEVFPEKGLSYYFEKNYIIITTDDPERISIYGKIIDGNTHEPLSFATVSLKGSKISNVSNGEGIFLLKFPETYAGDTLLFSYLGYDIKRVAISDLKSSRDLKVYQNTISLEASTFSLQPITVRAADAQTIVEEALSKISDNYPASAMQMTAFYREMIKKNSNYVTLTEAVLDIIKSSYTNAFSTDQVGIYKGRGSVDQSRIDTLLIKYKGGISSSFELDIMREPFLGTSPSTLSLYYDFAFEKPVILNDKVNYVISFTKKPGVQEILFRGKLFIESETLALTRAEFNMNVEGDPASTKIFVRSKPKDLKIDMIYAKYLVQYKEIDGKYTFDYSRSEIKFDTKWNRKLFKNTYTVVSEMAITDRSDKRIKIDPEQKVRTNDIAIDKVSAFNDEKFWDEYNIIEPESGIETIISRIIRQLKRRE